MPDSLPVRYFHRPKGVFDKRLEYPMVVRISKDGYTVQDIELTEGPLEWHRLNGRSRAPC